MAAGVIHHHSAKVQQEHTTPKNGNCLIQQSKNTKESSTSVTDSNRCSHLIRKSYHELFVLPFLLQVQWCHVCHYITVFINLVKLILGNIHNVFLISLVNTYTIFLAQCSVSHFKVIFVVNSIQSCENVKITFWPRL